MDFPGEKLVIKLWETLTEKGLGSLLSPWQTIREGRARIEVRRQELLMLAQAEKDASDLRAGRRHLGADGKLLLVAPTNNASNEPDGQVEPTVLLSNAVNIGTSAAAANYARNEINASRAIIYAEEQLVNDSQAPSDRDVEEDWLFFWREYAGKVSTEDLQRLWGSVLAGEIKCPGKYSIRTLEFLKTLSKSEAESISKLACYVIEDRIFRSQETYLESKGISFNFLLRMQELGVVAGVEGMGITTTFKNLDTNSATFLRIFASHNKALIVEHADPTKKIEQDVYLLTQVGKQVIGLGIFEPDQEYMRLVGKQIANQGLAVRIADWKVISEKQGRYENARAIET